MNINKKFYLLIVVSILTLIGALVVVLLLSRNVDNSVRSSGSVVSITVDNKINAAKSYTFEVVEDDISLLTALLNIQEKDDSFSFGFKTDPTLGAYITSINSYEPDVTKNEFWKIVVNDQDASVGISDIKLKNGDRIVFEIDNY